MCIRDRIKAGKNLFVESNNSGGADIGAAGTSGRGTVAPTALEMSNVDLAEEFTQMIITQRGFQANSRVITVSDELLQELVNLKRDVYKRQNVSWLCSYMADSQLGKNLLEACLLYTSRCV